MRNTCLLTKLTISKLVEVFKNHKCHRVYWNVQLHFIQISNWRYMWIIVKGHGQNCSLYVLHPWRFLSGIHYDILNELVFAEHITITIPLFLVYLQHNERKRRPRGRDNIIISMSIQMTRYTIIHAKHAVYTRKSVKKYSHKHFCQRKRQKMSKKSQVA